MVGLDSHSGGCRCWVLFCLVGFFDLVWRFWVNVGLKNS